MKLTETISKDFMTAFKAKNSTAKNVLSVIKGEIQTKEKNTGSEMSNDDVLNIITKTVKSIKETLKHTTESSSEFNELNKELDVLDVYMPKLMSESEIKEKIKELVDSGVTNIGGIMKAFSKLPADKELVSKLFKELT